MQQKTVGLLHQQFLLSEVNKFDKLALVQSNEWRPGSTEYCVGLSDGRSAVLRHIREHLVNQRR